MTHTLHRVGNEESLGRDYVLLTMPSKDINHEGSGPKLRRILEICLEKGAIKIGDARKGNQYFQGSLENMLDHVEDRAVVQAVFKDQGSLVEALKEIKKSELGMSIVVSGLFDRVENCLHQAGLEKHTVNQSLGRWGRTEKLPEQGILELNTMCGHGNGFPLPDRRYARAGQGRQDDGRGRRRTPVQTVHVRHIQSGKRRPNCFRLWPGSNGCGRGTGTNRPEVRPYPSGVRSAARRNGSSGSGYSTALRPAVPGPCLSA